MSKGKTAVCVCAMVASCITGGVLIADNAVSGNIVGKMSEELFSFDTQKLSNTMPNFAEPIVKNTKLTKPAEKNDAPKKQSNFFSSKTAINAIAKKLSVLYRTSDVNKTVLTQQAVTTTSVSECEEPEVTTTTEVITTEEVVTTTTTTIVTPAETAEETTTTTVAETEEVAEETTTTTTAYVVSAVPVTTTAVAEVPAVFEEDVYTQFETIHTNSTPYISDSDFIMLCNAVAHEAGSDWIDIYSKANVVEVIMNRVNSPLFPNTVLEVLAQPYQFEGYECYTYLGCYSYQVTDSVIEAVNLYFSDPSAFSQGYMYFYGDGYQNYFSTSC